MFDVTKLSNQELNDLCNQLSYEIYRETVDGDMWWTEEELQEAIDEEGECKRELKRRGLLK